MAEGGIHRKGEISLQTLLSHFKNKLGGGAGAIGSFIGIVRREAKKGGEVKKLHYECRESAAEELENIAKNIENSEDEISKVSIHHIVDDLGPGDEIIYVLVGGKHRKEVFEALPKIMNRVKDEVHIWKKEITENQSYWTHE